MPGAPLGEIMENNRSSPLRKKVDMSGLKGTGSRSSASPSSTGSARGRAMPEIVKPQNLNAENNEVLSEMIKEGELTPAIRIARVFESDSSKSSPVSSSDDDYESFAANMRSKKKSETLALSKLTSPCNEPAEFTKSPKTGMRMRPRHVIFIKDFDFIPKSLELSEDACVEFRLSFDVPSHAEHLLEGVSSTKGNCFLSPLLQKFGTESFVFTPIGPGDVAVSCTVFTDMVCKLTILKADSERLPLATPKLSGILGSGYSPGRNVPSSRLDSVRRSDERFLSADPEFEMLGPTVLGVGRRSLIEHGDSRSSSGVSDSDDESRGTESGIYSEEKIDFKRLVDSDKCSKIFVAEMSFSPKSLIVREGEEIYFINMGKSAVGISCGQEFQDVCLAPNSKPFVHVFNLVGEFFVVNLVYTFVKCPIIVKADVKQPVSLISDDLLQDSLPRPPMVTTGILGKPPRLMGSSAAFLKPLTTSTLAESSKNTEMLLGGFQKTNAAHSSASNMKIFDQLMEDVNKESQRKSVDVESKLDISQLKRPQTIASNISQTKVTAPAFNIFGKISPPKLKGSFPDIISVDEISKASESISETHRDVDYLDLMEMQPLADETETKKKKKKKKKKKRKSKSASSAVAMENADSEDEKETDDVIVSLQESAKNFYNPDGREQIKTIESIISEGVEAHQLENLTGPALPSWSSRPDRYRCFITPKFRSTGRESPFNDESINASISSVDIEEKNETEIDNFPVSSDHISYVVNEPTIIESKDEISAGVVHEEFLSMDDFIVVDKKKKKDKSKKVSQPQRIAVATESNSLDLSFEEELRMAIELSKLNSLEDEKGKSLIEFVNLTTDPTDKIKETELAVDAAKRKASELILTIERERLEALSCLETKVLLKKSAIEAAAMEKRVLADKDVLDAYAKADEDLAMITAEALAKAEAIKLKADKDAEDEISRANKKASQLKAKADKRAQYAKITVGKDADIALDALTSEINEEKKVIEKSVSDRIAEARAEAEAATKTCEDALVQLAKLLEEKATKELEEKAALAKAQEDVLVTDVPEKVDMNKTPKIRGKKSNSDEISSTQNSQDVQNSGKKTSPKKCIPDQKVTSKPDRSGGLKFSDEREEGNAYDEKRKENVEIFEFSVETKNVVIETAEVSYDAIIVDSQSMIHPCTAATDSSLSKSTISHCIQPDTSDTDLKGAHEGKKMKEKKKSKKGSLEKVVATEEINKDFIFVGSDEQISNMEIPTAISKENNLLTSFYQMELLLCQRMDILQSLIEHKEDDIWPNGKRRSVVSVYCNQEATVAAAPKKPRSSKRSDKRGKK